MAKRVVLLPERWSLTGLGIGWVGMFGGSF